MSATTSDAPKAVRYLGDHGLICYEYPLLGPDGMPPDKFVDTLLSSELTWLWLSESRARTPDESHDVDQRPLTVLTPSTANALVADLSIRDDDGYGLFAALFGGQGSRGPLAGTSALGLKDELRHFLSDRPRFLEIVVVQIGDTPNDYIFLRRDAGPATARILSTWGISESVSTERDYRKLRVARLEQLFRLF